MRKLKDRAANFFRRVVILVFGLLGVVTAKGEDVIVTGKVISVIDGNTIEVQSSDNEVYKILIFGIDCPEIDQEYGEKAKRLLEKMILEKEVSVQFQGKDRWGNRFGIVLMEGEIDPRLELLEQGLAWTAERNPIEELETVKLKAKEKGRGLWRQDNPIPPWTYRRQQTMLEPKTR